jgi:hypothetical protein
MSSVDRRPEFGRGRVILLEAGLIPKAALTAHYIGRAAERQASDAL